MRVLRELWQPALALTDASRTAGLAIGAEGFDFAEGLAAMTSNLPATDTAALIDLVAPGVPEDFINKSWPQGRTGGRHREHTAA